MLLKKQKIVLIIALILFFLPFFWLSPGEMDLGGDSNRLFFYDPWSNLKAFAIYSVAPYGTGRLLYNQYFIPYLLFLSLLKSIFGSPTNLIAIFNGFKLSGSFMFMFLIITELANVKFGRMEWSRFTSAVIGALFYTFSPAVVDNMKYALVTHDLVFLNPLIFFLLLKSIKNSSMRYLWLTIFISFVFSSSFALFNPPIAAFYPLAVTFLLLYNVFILGKPIPWKGVFFGAIFFVGLHAFHIIPVVSNVFDQGSEFNTRIFESTSGVNPGLEYFNSILSLGKVSRNFLLPLENQRFGWSLITIPILVVLGLLSVEKKNKALLLVSFFFLITLFLISANITQVGVEFYRKLFSIPGFGMFRNFFGQWQWGYTFFYSLLVGLSISYFFLRLRDKYVYIIFLATIGFLVARSWTVFNGDIVNVIHRESNNVKVPVRIDPHYEKLLSYIKKIPNDGKILHIPFTDYGYNIVGGTNKGAYIGISMVSQLAGRNDFAGYQSIDPFSAVFVELVREKNYPLIKQMLSLLQVRYILYNSDELVSDTFFPTFPYGYTGTPTSPSAALEFVRAIADKKIYETGSYSLFEVEMKQYLPKFYAAAEIFFYEMNPEHDVQYGRALSFFPTNPREDSKDSRVAFIERRACHRILAPQTCERDSFQADIKDIEIIYQRVNPVKYRLKIKNFTKPFLLVLQNDFTSHWKLFKADTSLNAQNISDSYFDGKIIELQPVHQVIDRHPLETNDLKSVYDNNHIKVNGYANAWYIKPADMSEDESYEVIVEMTAQKRFYYSLGISILSLSLFVMSGVKIFLLP